MPQDDNHFEIEYLGITEAAEYLRVSASTLRRWEKKGFLVPERTPTGIRRYTKQQLDDVIQSPDGFSSSHTHDTENESTAPKKLQPHEELQASIQKQLEELDTEQPQSLNVSTIDQPLALSQPEPVREEPLVHTTDNFNVVHNYPPYGVTNLKPEEVYNDVADVSVNQKVIEDHIDEPPLDKPEVSSESIYSYNASSNKSLPEIFRYKKDHFINNDKDEDETFDDPQVKNSEIFHHEYEVKSVGHEDLEEYDTDAATLENESHSSKPKKSFKLPPKVLWGSLAGVVLLVVGISVWLLISASGPTELISPLAQ